MIRSRKKSPVAHRGSNAQTSRRNVFSDLGFDRFEAEELAVKSDLISLLGLAIADRGLTQRQAADICRTHQASLSKILSGKLESVTIDQLAKWYVAMGGSICISVSKPARAASARRGSLTLER